MAKIQTTKNFTKKDVILQKAATLFRSRGYNATSMRELAESVGVEAPSLYNHIGSKAELLQAICFKMAGIFIEHIDSIEQLPISNAQKIERFIRFHIHMMLDNFDEVFVANHEWKHLDEPMLTQFLGQRRSIEKRLVTMIENGIDAKEFKKTNPYVAVLLILSAVRGLEFWQRNKKNIPPGEIENDMVNHLLNGIVK